MNAPTDAAALPEPPIPFWAVLAMTTGFVAFVALICAKAVDQDCHQADPPVLIPQAGTPRADYCSAVEHLPLVPTLIAAPVLAAALAMLLLRRRPRIAAAVVALIVVATIANAVIVWQLDWYGGPLI